MPARASLLKDWSFSFFEDYIRRANAEPNKKPPEGGLVFLGGPGRNRPGLGMSNSDDSSNNQLPRLGHYHLGRWDSEPPRLRHYSQLM